ncbi:MAG: D-lyxose/D-mannose family sugar isomerase [Phycisphaerae bacterium]
MDELKKALDIAVREPIKQKALDDFGRQMKDWNLVVPPVEPLVWDFGLNDFAKIGLIEYWIANEAEAGYCGKYLFVFAGQTCPTHRHQIKHETFFIVRGKVEMMYDQSVREMHSGDVLPVPAGKVHRFTGIGSALLLELSTPCRVDDNYFENTQIPIGGNYKG